MCGIFGAICQKQKFNPAIITGLAILNENRGNEALGFFDSSGRILKRAGIPTTLAATKRFRRYVECSSRNAWCIGGHTRFGTQGLQIDENAHPFEYGDIVGSHNGMVHYPGTYNVDSEYLFDTINKEGTYGIEKIHGYWGLAWLDKAKELFWLTVHNGNLAYAEKDGVLYYSSDADHLRCFCSNVLEFDEGQLVCFDKSGNVWDSNDADMNAIVATEDYWTSSAYTSSKGYVRTDGKNGYDYSGVNTNRGYYSSKENNLGYSQDGTEDDWREDWTKYIHSQSDNQFEKWDQFDQLGSV